MSSAVKFDRYFILRNYFMTELRKIRRALISVSDKTGVIELARELNGFDVKIISTGGTAKTLRENGIDVTEVSEITGFPEMMNGRVKTLHPKIHGAFLGLRDNAQHLEAMKTHQIEPIDLVVVNLYPFEQTIESEDVPLEEAIEQIDIGGPAMIRSASKNWRDVAVLTDARLYETVLEEMRETGGSLSLETRRRLATLAYTRTASYDLTISSYLAKQLSTEDLDFLEPFNPLGNLSFIETGAEEDEPDAELADYVSIELAKITDLRYGENPHQKAALYETGESGGIARAEQLHGKEMSFNNYLDAEAAWRIVSDFDELACAIIKHTNPSGVGTGENNEEAYRRALATDPVSAFGGIVAFNRTVDAQVAESVNEIFTEVVLAPEFDREALEIFKRKKNLRVLRVKKSTAEDALEYHTISGGMLVQNRDDLKITKEDLKIVTEKQPTEEQIRALLFAWKVCKHVKSNAIVFANEFQTVGVGAGQMNRVDSVRIAAMRAGRAELTLENSVLASDAFFPFRDNIDEAAKLGIAAIIQPGGSIKDDEVIQAANEHELAMVLTGARHFKH
ncbi:MAG: IMP cyclohydrolase / Phosphoribosylaminoimidazolecarboxamide formyltransferase [uncultured Pyrinomonadaceae bacterium]|uniref:Bifunctional purine biosynthesis protein PurH n=1 Tax=uncultured Pyrinomonadaceae bacterium TaxID=2283094 RepID=A0A6J4Q8J8_9BACT|nr:MAG: IMP cyclohydrolase / Phosphoribosylaminoimidazolecarboxamide formyltransferase [uncultured Pyrinomonadaceae bacterium]